MNEPFCNPYQNTHVGTSLNSWRHGISQKKLHIRWMTICVHSFFTKDWTIKIFFCHKGSHHYVQIPMHNPNMLAKNHKCKAANFITNFIDHDLTIVVAWNLFFHRFVLSRHKFCVFFNTNDMYVYLCLYNMNKYMTFMIK